MPVLNASLDEASARHLCLAWRAWATNVTRYVQTRRASGGESKYRVLHSAVLEAIERRKSVVGDDQALERARLIAAPWVSLEACGKAPTVIQRDLVLQCAECDREFCGKPRGSRTSSGAMRRMLGVAMGVIVLTMLVVFLFSDVDSVILPIRYHLWRAGNWLTHGPVVERIAAGSAVMFGIGWWMLHSLRPN
jgi:hypothetical protein